jgi:hypothetical protein
MLKCLGEISRRPFSCWQNLDFLVIQLMRNLKPIFSAFDSCLEKADLAGEIILLTIHLLILTVISL